MVAVVRVLFAPGIARSVISPALREGDRAVCILPSREQGRLRWRFRGTRSSYFFELRRPRFDGHAIA